MKSPLPSPPPPAARQRRKNARPQELLDAARDLFVEKGFAATRTEEVALRAGVSKGTLYLYYPSKEELLKAVVRDNVVSKITHGMDVIDQFEGSTSDLLVKVLRLWWELVGETPASGVLKLMMSEVGNFPEVAAFYVEEVIEPSHQMIASIVQRGMDSGEFRRLPNVEDVVHALIAPLLFLVMNKHSLDACSPGTPLQPMAVINTHLDLVLHGLQTAPVPSAARKKGKAR